MRLRLCVQTPAEAPLPWQLSSPSALDAAVKSCHVLSQAIGVALSARAAGDDVGFANALEAAGLTVAELVRLNACSALSAARLSCMPAPESCRWLA